MADEKFLKIVRDWAPIVLEPIASKVGLRNAVAAFAAAAGKQADALALFQKRPDRRVRPGAEAILLRPDRSPVPFAGRDTEVAEFEDWMFSDGWMKWRLLTGPSGRGKTRLMMGVVDRLNAIGDRPVRAGFLDLEKMERNPAALGGFAGDASVKGDLLLVVDYAERARQPVVAVLKLALMLEQLAKAGIERKVRIVLIARGLSEVWEDIGRQHHDIQEVLMAEGLELVELPPLAETVPDRLAEFDRAYAAFDRYFREVEQGDPPPADRRPDLSPSRGRDDYADAIMVHLAALAIHQGAVNAADISAQRLLNWIVDRERGEWSRRIAHKKLEAEVPLKAMEEAVGIATLTALSDGAPDMYRFINLLAACPLLGDQTTARRMQIADILHDLYPCSGHTNGLTPDLIGTWFLGQLDPTFYRSIFPSLFDNEAIDGLTRLNWLAQSWRVEREPWNRYGSERIWASIGAAPVRILPLVVDVAEQSGHPIGRIAAEWFETNGSTRLAQSVSRRRRLPHPTTALQEFAVQVETSLLRDIGDDDSDITLATRAEHANRLCLRLSALGRREEALAASEQAVDLYRDLADTRPDAFRPNLAMSLNNLANRLSDLGRREEALAAIEQAVAIRRALADTRPDAFRPDLAGSLNNLANRLSDLGRREEALAAIEQAVALYRTLADAKPDAFRPDLAMSLNNLSGHSSGLGRREEALAASEQAVALYRDLADTRPDAFRPDLAMSLNNLSVRLSDLGRREEALAAIEQAGALYRALADANPDAFRPGLASSLNNLANRLSALGRREEALAASEQAVAIRRDLAAARPDAFRPDLASSLNNLSVRLSDLGRREEALAASEQAVAIRRDLADTRPDAFRPDLAMSLNNLANRLSDLGRREEALAAIEQAVALYRDLADTRPDAFRPDLAMSLNNLANRLSDLGRREEALTTIEEAVAIRRDLADSRPDAFVQDLARSLGAYGQILAFLDRAADAAESFGEGLHLLAPYLQRLPQAFARLSAALLRNHLQSLLAAGQEPDWESLAPIVEILVEQGALDLGDLGGTPGDTSSEAP